MNTNAVAIAAFALGAFIYLAPFGVMCLDPLGTRVASRCDGPDPTRCTDQVPVQVRYAYPGVEGGVVAD